LSDNNRVVPGAMRRVVPLRRPGTGDHWAWAGLVPPSPPAMTTGRSRISSASPAVPGRPGSLGHRQRRPVRGASRRWRAADPGPAALRRDPIPSAG